MARSDKGRYLLTPRDCSIMRMVGHQQAVRLDQYQVLMTRYSEYEFELGELIGYSTMMDRIYKLRDAGYLRYARILAHGPGWLWLTRRGLDAAGLGYPAKTPYWNSLNHLYAINQIYLYERWAYWRSERSIRSARQEGAIPDGLLWETKEAKEPIAIEAEISLKNVARREKKLRALVDIFSGYHRVRMYVSTEAIYRGMNRALQKLDDMQQEKIELILQPYIDPGTPDYGG